MAQRVAAIFDSRDEAERAAQALIDLGAERDQISLMARGEEGADQRTSSSHPGDGDQLVEPAREVGDSGAALTTTEGADVAHGATIGAVAGIAAGLLALMVPGIGLVLAAGPLALAAASGAIAGGVYGGLRDIGIDEQHARGYEEHVRGGRVLLTGLLTHADETETRAALAEHGGDDISFHEVPAAAPQPAATAALRDQPAAGRAATATEEIRVPVSEEIAEVRKTQRQVGEVSVSKQVEVETKHISEPVTRTRVEVERRAVPAGEQAAYDASTTPLKEGDTIRVPIVEEELKVQKVQRVTGEVVIRKETETRQAEQDVQLRHERVEVEEEDESAVDTVTPSAPRRNA